MGIFIIFLTWVAIGCLFMAFIAADKRFSDLSDKQLTIICIVAGPALLIAILPLLITHLGDIVRCLFYDKAKGGSDV
jgi:hypothetical protein